MEPPIPEKLRELLRRAPWRDLSHHILEEAPAGLLSENESLVMYHVARDWFSGSGAVVDAGAYLGCSAFLTAAGICDNSDTPRRPRTVHSYDNFITSAYTAESILRDMGVEVQPDQSFRHLFESNTADYADMLVVHEGDFLATSWSDDPIEILIVDLAKTRELHAKILMDFYGSLIPGKSVVIHQDYHHYTVPWIAIGVEVLREYFVVLEPRVDQTMVLLNTKAIPPEELARATGLGLEDEEQVALIDAAIEHLPRADRHYLRLAKINLLRELDRRDELEEAFAEIESFSPEHRWKSDEFNWSLVRQEIESIVRQATGWGAFVEGDYVRAREIAELGVAERAVNRLSLLHLLAASCFVLDDVDGVRAAIDSAQPDDVRVADVFRAQLAHEHDTSTPDDDAILRADAHDDAGLLSIYYRALLGRSWRMIEAGHHSSALRTARRVSPMAAKDLCFEALHIECHALRRLARYDEAFTVAQRALELSPDRAEIHVEMSWLFLDTGKPEEAYEAAMSAVEHTDTARVGGDAAWSYAVLCEAARRVERSSEAVAAGTRAVEVVSNNSWLWCRLSLAQALAEDLDEAKVSAQRALVLDVDCQEAADVLDRIEALQRQS